MKPLTKYLLADREEYLLQCVRKLIGQESLSEAFAGWILFGQSPLTFDLGSIGNKTTKLYNSSPSADHVATLGYVCSTANSTPQLLEVLKQGLDWMSGRQALPASSPPTFETDGITVLGIVLGSNLLSAQTHPIQHWLDELLPRIPYARLSSWDRSLLDAATFAHRKVLSSQGSSLPICSDILLAFHTKGINIAEIQDDCLSETLQLILRSERQVTPEWAAVQLAALRFLYRSALHLNITQIHPNEIIQILDGLSRSFKRWTWESTPKSKKSTKQQWDIQNEYHVQNLVWVVLATLFHDLEDEENLPSLGHKHPRADIGLPSLRLIVEVKFMRKGTQAECSEMIEQIASDASLYLTPNSGYDEIVALVWDDSATTEQHHELKQGLMKIAGVVGAVIISRPKTMNRGK